MRRTDMSKAVLAKEIDISPSLLSRWMSGDRDTYSVTNDRNLSRLAKQYPACKQAFFHIRQEMRSRNDWPSNHEVRYVIDSDPSRPVTMRVYQQYIHLGEGTPVLEETALTFDAAEHYRDRYIVEVVGDSMSDADIRDGDRLVMKSASTYRNGDVVHAIVDGRHVLKEARRNGDGTVTFHPANSEYSALTVSEEEVEVIGILDEIIRKYRPQMR